MATFGKTATSSDETALLSGDYKQGSNYQLSDDGSVSKLTAYIKEVAGPQKLRGVIYASSATPSVDLPTGALLGTTQEVTIPSGSTVGWVDFTFSSPVDLTAGYYFLGLHASSEGGFNGPAIFMADVVASTRFYNADAYSGGASDPFGTIDGNDAHEFSIYATYGPTSGTYTILNGSDEQLLNVNAGGIDVDAASYKDGVALSNDELATLLDGTSFGKRNIAVLPNLAGVVDARQIKKTTFSAETESA